MVFSAISLRHFVNYGLSAIAAIALLFTSSSYADDDNSHYTNVGNIGLTITNFGTIGHGFTLWPQQPSCEYPQASGIELIDGGIWVGVERTVLYGQPELLMLLLKRGEGFEFKMRRTNNYRQVFFNNSRTTVLAISPEFVCEYIDIIPVGGQIILNHIPWH
jgi:hypothetical protein